MQVTHSKFTLYGFNGKAKSWYTVDDESIDLGKTKEAKKVPGHSIIVVDRSGSMWSDIEPLKDMLIKLLTLDEYNNSDMLVSLLSYSTCGDCQVHFERVQVKDVMKAGSAQQKAIRHIHSSGLTCISQAMNVAKGLVHSGEPTAITVHSDGYANDPSVWSEQKQVMAVCEGIKGQNVFVNTVAYRSSSDFTFLSAVANAASGKCIRADGVKQVYDALYEASASVCGETTQPIDLPIAAAQYQVFVSKSKGRVNGSSSDLSVAGIGKGDDATVYRYREVTASEYAKSTATVCQHGDALLALARAKLAEGRINEAKLAMFSSCIKDLASKHAKALTGPQLATMATDIETCLFGGKCDRTAAPESIGGAVTVLDVIKVLEGNRDGVMLDLGHLVSSYKPRGVKRVPGVRMADGAIEKPWLEMQYTDDGKWVQMGTFEVNRNSATVNLMVTRPSRLVKVAGGEAVSQVAGISVASLPSFRNFTVVGDGEVTVPQMKLKFGTIKAFEAVKALGVLSGNGKYDCAAEYTVDLDKLPVSPYEFAGNADGLHDSYREVLEDKVLVSILSAVTKEVSTDYTPEQVEELKKHYLSKSLNVNFPTTTEYEDLEKALTDGVVDTRVSYKVEIGDTAILNLGRIKSANEFLDRHFVAVDAKTGQASKDKPKMDMFLDPKYIFTGKAPSAKMKITAADTFCKPIFEEFLGTVPWVPDCRVGKILARAGIKKSVYDLVRGGPKAMLEAMKAVEAHQEAVFRDRISPLVFFIGATGMLPDSIDAKAESADTIESRIDGLKLAKAERDGTFFQAGDVVVSVYAKNEYFSTGKK